MKKKRRRRKKEDGKMNKEVGKREKRKTER